MNIRGETLRALAAMDITEPTPIQAEATPRLLAGADVVGQARTGSGKTLAFSIPLVEKCDPELAVVQALVLVPTRELAFQVGSVIEDLSRSHRLRCAFLYGGRDVADQQTLLASGPQVVIGTPGRLLDLLYRGNLRLNDLRFMVVDEADEMFDEGFGPDVDLLLECILHRPQIAMFSATIPDWVQLIASRRLNNPEMVRVETNERPVETVNHKIIEVSDGDKLNALKSLLDGGEDTSVVFCRTKDGVQRLAGQLAASGYRVASLRGNMMQTERERVMRAFRRGEPPTLVATNVAARGLDIAHISRVINYDLPDSLELLTHRLGRTGRMGRAGEAMTFVTPRDRKRWAGMQGRLGLHVTREQWSGAARSAANKRPAPPSTASRAVISGEKENRARSRNGTSARFEKPSTRRTPPRIEQAASTSGSRRQPESRDSESRRTEYRQAECAGCGTQVRVSWVPTAARPAYCSSCREVVSVAV